MKSSSSQLNTSNLPQRYRTNFAHLYFDIAWFGVLSGSAINFITVYATRIGATGVQIGLFGATTALVSLIFALPAGRWLDKPGRTHSVFWASIVYRLGFLFYIPIPWLLNAKEQIWVLVLLSLLMGIPFVALSVGSSALFADSVPVEWRALVAGRRNIVFSVMFMITSLACGYFLDHILFPLNYQIVFFMGFVGGAMSSYHLYFIKPVPAVISHPITTTFSIHKEPNPRGFPVWLTAIRIDVLATKFRSTLIVMMIFHIAQYLALPVFPLYFVRYLKLSDLNLGIGTALFYFTVLIGSTQLNRLVGKLGHKDVTGWGVVGMAVYPALLALSSLVWQYYVVSIVGGLAWALVGGASTNYVIENCPEKDRSSHLAWYNIVLNASILIGSLLGPLIASTISLPIALLFFGLFRGLAGIAILKWG